MLLKYCALLYACLVFWQPAVARAQSPTRINTGFGTGLSVNADYSEMTRENGNQIVELKGNVQIVYEQQYITCDRAIIHVNKQEIEAIGNLVINSTQAYVEGDGAVLSYKDNTAVIVNGFVKSGQVIFEGKVVKKTGVNTYEAETASFTACTTCPTAWTFGGSKIQAEIGGYAYIKNSVLRVANVPVFWLPYLIVPLKSERQTGILTPQFEYSNVNGTGISSSLFWAMSRSQDATITAKHYAKRGFKGLLNYRYMLSGESEGELDTGYIRDRVFAGTPEVAGQDVGSRSNRWFVNYKHSYELPDGFIQKTKLAFASDLRYPHDFPQELKGRGEPALENRFSLTKNTERTHASMDAAYYINMLQANPIAGNGDAVHRWPEIRYSLVNRAVADDGIFSDLSFNMNFNYTNFARENYSFDVMKIGTDGTPEVDPTRATPDFSPSRDIIRTGQRIDLQPELAHPFHLGAFDFLPTVQVRHTQYALNVTPPAGDPFDTSPFRQYVRGKISTRTRLSKIYGDRSQEAQAPKAKVTNWIDAESRQNDSEIPMITAPVRSNLFRHEVEPEVSFSGIPYINQTADSQFFGRASDVPSFQDDLPLSDLDFESTRGRGVQFDYEDRLLSRNAMTFALTNRLVRKAWNSGTPTYKQIATWKLAQSYDFDEEKRAPGRPTFPWSDISSLLDIRLENVETNTLVRHFPYHNKTNTSSRVKIMDDSGRFAQMNFKQTYQITQNVNEAYNGREENLSLTAGFDSKYLTFAGAINYIPLGWAPVDLRAQSHSVLLNLKPPGDCWGILAAVTKRIDADPDLSVSFDYKFGGF